MVNEGKSAGASLEHSHAQLFALPFVPVMVARERERFTAHNTRTMGSCLLCDLLQDEVRMAIGSWRSTTTPSCLPPSRLEPLSSSSSCRDSMRAASLEVELGGVAAAEGLQRLAAVLGAPPPLNLWLRTAPRDAEHYHWRIDVVPRLTQLAGLELGAGIGVNVYAPERAAADLRDAG